MLNKMISRIVLALCFALCGQPLACSPAPRRPSSATDAPTVLRELARRYRALHSYRDMGTISDQRADGVVHQKWFTTEFERSSHLRFEFGDTPNTPTSARTALIATSLKIAHIVEVHDSEREVGGPMSTAMATGELQGVSLYGSALVPRLVYGIELCNCMSDPAWTVEPNEVSDGRSLTPLRLRSDSMRSMTLWVDSMTGLLRKVELQTVDGGRVVARTTIKYEISQVD